MGNLATLADCIQELRATGQALTDIAETLTSLFTSAEEPEEQIAPVAVSKPPRTFTKEEVRRMMVDKCSAAGGAYKLSVKELIRQYANGGTFSDVPADRYATLVAELEVIGNAG